MSKPTYFLLAILLLNGFYLFAQQRLSEKATISVITCGPWQGELYSAFGHSAFRVHDPELGIDEAYNYGVFDFDQPNFYLNFARGYLYYQLGVYDYPAFRDHYIYYNRYIHEQLLNLTQDQKQKVYDYLQWNARPENKQYRYDYFYDNCATKLRDVIKITLGDAVVFDGRYVNTDYTIRDLTDIYLTQQPWGDLGIDICLGLPMDKKATPYEYMFLPDYIESGFDHAYFLNHNDSIPLVKEKTIVYEARDEDPVPGLPHPTIVFSIIAVIGLVISFFNIRRRKLSQWFDILLFGVTGLIGLLLFFLWVATDHAAAAKNYNLLWAVPAHLMIVFVLFKKRNWIQSYFLSIASLQVALLISWPFLAQDLHEALIPIVILLAARAFVQFYVRRIKAN